jgi:hypothetical protein
MMILVLILKIHPKVVSLLKMMVVMMTMMVMHQVVVAAIVCVYVPTLLYEHHSKAFGAILVSLRQSHIHALSGL